MAVAVLMPVFNEREALAETLANVRRYAGELLAAVSSDKDGPSSADAVTVFVVDDGSVPAVDSATLPTQTATFRIVLARHVINLGQGAALETARQLALRHGPFRAYVTMDADGQHDAADAVELVRAVGRGGRGGADVAFGDRFAGGSRVPRSRRILLHLARIFENGLTGLRLSDAHNGLRAFSPRGIRAIAIRQNRMAHATEIRQQVSRRALRSGTASELRVVEVPVSVTYSPASLEKGQRALGAVAIVRDLFQRFLFEEPS